MRTRYQYRDILLTILDDKYRDGKCREECYCHAKQIVEVASTRTGTTHFIVGYLLTGDEAPTLEQLTAKYPMLPCEVTTRRHIITKLSTVS